MGEHISERFTKRIAKEFEDRSGAIIPNSRGNRIWYDGGNEAVSGFGLRVTAAGVMSFILNYRHRGRERRITIGRWPAWTAQQARERARELRRMVDSGTDPLGVKEQERSAPRMSDLFARYFTEYAEIHKKPRSVADDRYLVHGSNIAKSGRVLEGIIGKHFANMHVDAVSSDDVRPYHLGLKATPIRANRALSLLSKMFNLAEEWNYRPLHSNPCKHVKKYGEKARERYLNADELAQLGNALDAMESTPRAAAAIRMLLFTGMRVGELLGLRWSNIDMKSGVARLEDAKAGGRDVQLPAPALAVLTSLSRGEPSDSILGMYYGELHNAWQRIRKAAGFGDVRLHDLRHTTGTYAGSAGFNAFLVKQLLGHKTLSMTDKYVGKHVDPLREASNRVANQIDAAMKGKQAEIVELSKHGVKP